MYKIMRVVAVLQPLTRQHYIRWIFIRSQFRTTTTTAEIRRLSDKEIESSPYPYILHLYYNGFMAYSVCIAIRLSTHYYCIGLSFIVLWPIATYWSRSHPMVRCTFTCNSIHMMSLSIARTWLNKPYVLSSILYKFWKNVCKHDVITGVMDVTPPILLQRCKFYCSCNRLCCMLHVACCSVACCMFYVLCFIVVVIAVLGQQLVQLAALLSCHYCNYVLAAVCAWRWQNKWWWWW